LIKDLLETKIILAVNKKRRKFLIFCMGVKVMNKNWSKDSLGLRLLGLHQTWKWLHQTIELHEYLIFTGTDRVCSMSKKHMKKH